MFLLTVLSHQPDLFALAESHVAWVERQPLTEQSLSFSVEGTEYSLTLYQAGPVGTVKARFTQQGAASSLVATQWLERGVPCYAEFTHVQGDTQRGARIWLSDGDEVYHLKGYSTVVGSGELPAVDPGPLPIWATQLTAHTLKELGKLCEKSDSDCVL